MANFLQDPSAKRESSERTTPLHGASIDWANHPADTVWVYMAQVIDGATVFVGHRRPAGETTDHRPGDVDGYTAGQ